MTGNSLFVLPGGLDVGASRCHDASTSAASGADLIRNVPLQSGIFGDFAAAQEFHGMASESHDQQVGTFTAHANQLAELSGKGRIAAQVFTAGDEQGAATIDGQVSSGER